MHAESDVVVTGLWDGFYNPDCIARPLFFEVAVMSMPEIQTDFDSPEEFIKCFSISVKENFPKPYFDIFNRVPINIKIVYNSIK